MLFTDFVVASLLVVLTHLLVEFAKQLFYTFKCNREPAEQDEPATVPQIFAKSKKKKKRKTKQNKRSEQQNVRRNSYTDDGFTSCSDGPHGECQRKPVQETMIGQSVIFPESNFNTRVHIQEDLFKYSEEYTSSITYTDYVSCQKNVDQENEKVKSAELPKRTGGWRTGSEDGQNLTPVNDSLVEGNLPEGEKVFGNMEFPKSAEQPRKGKGWANIEKERQNENPVNDVVKGNVLEGKENLTSMELPKLVELPPKGEGWGNSGKEQQNESPVNDSLVKGTLLPENREDCHLPKTTCKGPGTKSELGCGSEWKRKYEELWREMSDLREENRQLKERVNEDKPYEKDTDGTQKKSPRKTSLQKKETSEVKNKPCCSKDLDKESTASLEQVLSSVKTQRSKPKIKVKACGSCPASCVLDCLFFALEAMKFAICRTSFVRELHRRIKDPKVGDLQFNPDLCTSYMKTLLQLGLVKPICYETIDGNLDEIFQQQIDKLKKSRRYLVLLVLGYRGREVGHCMVKLCAKETSVFDAQQEKWWPESIDDVQDVRTIQIYEINKEEFKNWQSFCGKTCCTSLPQEEVGCVRQYLKDGGTSEDALDFASIPPRANASTGTDQ